MQAMSWAMQAARARYQHQKRMASTISLPLGQHHHSSSRNLMANNTTTVARNKTATASRRAWGHATASSYAWGHATASSHARGHATASSYARGHVTANRHARSKLLLFVSGTERRRCFVNCTCVLLLGKQSKLWMGVEFHRWVIKQNSRFHVIELLKFDLYMNKNRCEIYMHCMYMHIYTYMICSTCTSTYSYVHVYVHIHADLSAILYNHVPLVVHVYDTKKDVLV